MKGKYLLMTGAPGSRWSGVANHIWKSKSFDQTDDATQRRYKHHNGLVHGGAYFDPMMEFENDALQWDKPFYGEGIRLIKSHTFAYQLDYLTQYRCPIVLVIRNDYECWKWWNECGGFDIPYPNYAWYKNQNNMFNQIQLQNQAITTFIYKNRDRIVKCDDNLDVLGVLELDTSAVVRDVYEKKDVSVYVYH